MFATRGVDVAKTHPVVPSEMDALRQRNPIGLAVVHLYEASTTIKSQYPDMRPAEISHAVAYRLISEPDALGAFWNGTEYLLNAPVTDSHETDEGRALLYAVRLFRSTIDLSLLHSLRYEALQSRMSAPDAMELANGEVMSFQRAVDRVIQVLGFGEVEPAVYPNSTSHVGGFRRNERF